MHIEGPATPRVARGVSPSRAYGNGRSRTAFHHAEDRCVGPNPNRQGGICGSREELGFCKGTSSIFLVLPDGVECCKQAGHAAGYSVGVV